MTGGGGTAAIAMFLAGLGVGPAQAELELLTAMYRCERGITVPVSYINGSDGSAVVLHVEGRQITLLQDVAASGARYAWHGGGSGYVWWSKGNAATLFWHDAETGQEAPLLSDCLQE